MLSTSLSVHAYSPSDVPSTTRPTLVPVPDAPPRRRERRVPPAKPRRTYDRTLSEDARADEQRERILNAAVASYEERGYAKTSIADIADGAQVSRRTIYAHFRTIEDLRFAVYERAVQRTIVAVAQAMMDEVRDPLRHVLETAFSVCVENTALSRACLYEFQAPEARNIQIATQIRELFVGALVQGSTEDVARGRTPRALTETDALALIGSLVYLLRHCVDHPEDASRCLETMMENHRARFPFTPDP